MHYRIICFYMNMWYIGSGLFHQTLCSLYVGFPGIITQMWLCGQLSRAGFTLIVHSSLLHTHPAASISSSQVQLVSPWHLLWPQNSQNGVLVTQYPCLITVPLLHIPHQMDLWYWLNQWSNLISDNMCWVRGFHLPNVGGTHSLRCEGSNLEFHSGIRASF